MSYFLGFLLLLAPASLAAEDFSCPVGQADIMKYFVMDKEKRVSQFLAGDPNPIYTEIFPDSDFAKSGYWFWLKSPKAHGFDVKSFDPKHIYMRSTELTWKDNTSFKRFVHDHPIAARCVPEGEPGPEIRVEDTRLAYVSSCRPYKSSNLGTVITHLDAPQQLDLGGNIGQVWTRVLHYVYDCDRNYQNCKDEEQFYLAAGYGLWQWKHYKNGELAKSAVMNNIKQGRPNATAALCGRLSLVIRFLAASVPA
jgi:hypothetical protein